MKLATVNPRMDVNMETLLSKDVSFLQSFSMSGVLNLNFQVTFIIFGPFSDPGIHDEYHEPFRSIGPAILWHGS